MCIVDFKSNCRHLAQPRLNLYFMFHIYINSTPLVQVNVFIKG